MYNDIIILIISLPISSRSWEGAAMQSMRVHPDVGHMKNYKEIVILIIFLPIPSPSWEGIAMQSMRVYGEVE